MMKIEQIMHVELSSSCSSVITAPSLRIDSPIRL
jgi:hypothetical protein